MQITKEAIYIAGPECFYINGNAQLLAMRRDVEAHGMSVTLPNDSKLNLEHEDLRLNADEIFRNCAESMNRSTGIICDLEFYRGPEPDGGSVFEIGMAYARGIRCYGYTRDKREIKWKYHGFKLENGIPYDKKGRRLPNYDLPFSPNVIGSTKIIAGDFHDCLKAYLTDLEEERKYGCRPFRSRKFEKKAISEKPVIYLSSPDRYSADAETIFKPICDYCIKKGLYPTIPYIPESGFEKKWEDPYERAYQVFLKNLENVCNADIVLGNLNDFHGWEPESDTSFECGMAFQLGKYLYGYMDDIRIMRERVPNLGPDYEWRDICGCNTENFNYPLNLMFSSSMRSITDSVYEVIDKISDDYYNRSR